MICTNREVYCPVDNDYLNDSEYPGCIMETRIEKVCRQAFKCFAMHVTDQYGDIKFVTGCLGGPDGYNGFLPVCGKPSNWSASAAYFSHCCDDRDYCNDHDIDQFVLLHQPEHHKTWKFPKKAVIAGSLFAVLAILLVMFIYFYMLRKKGYNPKPSTGNTSRNMENGIRDVQEMTPLPVSNNNDHGILDNQSSHHNFGHSSHGGSHFHQNSNSNYPLLGQDLTSNTTAALKNWNAGHSTLENASAYDYCLSSGSGSGGQQLVMKTLGKELKFSKSIGSGRYGDVWLAHRLGDALAVKTFRSFEDKSYTREKDFYALPLISHKNILAFSGADCTTIDGEPTFVIAVEYHPLGSLFDYFERVKETGISFKAALNISYSAVSGLVHLHGSLNCDQTKPRIAHRDLKSKNLLVKGGCSPEAPVVCLADFGLAVWESSRPIVEEALKNPRVGTKRYMSPEVLSFSPDPVTGEDGTLRDFDSLLRTDVYSMALVLWEIFRIVKFEGQEVTPHEIPYLKDVPTDPSYSEMKSLVVDGNKRPPFPETWIAGGEDMYKIRGLIEESWKSKPAARLTMSYVKNKLKTIMKENGLYFD